MGSAFDATGSCSGDDKFMLEFDTDEIRRRIIEGGPWRHRSDALLVVPYDGFSPPHLS
jgi:hypothetical protein